MSKKKELRPLTVDAVTLRTQIKKFCEDNAYPNNAETSLLQTMDALKETKEEFRHRFLSPIDDYFQNKEIDFTKATSRKKYFSMTNSVAKKLEISNMPLAITFYYCLLPKLREKYKEAGLSEKLYYETVDFLRSKLYECYRVFGIWGTFDSPSFYKIFTLERFCFGRLAFEVTKADFQADIGTYKVKKGQKIVQVYLPSVDYPTEEEMLESFRQAYEFFHNDIGEEVVFMLNSWVLYPVHRDFLQEGDFYLTVMNMFKLVSEKKMPKNPDYWCIFNRMYKKEDKEDLFIDSPLEINYDKYIKSGKCMGRGVGVLLYDGKEFVR